MHIVKVMKRKDASSVLVAILLAMMLNSLLMVVTNEPSAWLSGLGDEQGFGFGTIPGADWKFLYLHPVVSFVVQLVALEVLLRVVTWVHPFFVRKGK